MNNLHISANGVVPKVATWNFHKKLPSGEWATVTVIKRGSLIKTYVDGLLKNETTLATPEECIDYINALLSVSEGAVIKDLARWHRVLNEGELKLLRGEP